MYHVFNMGMGMVLFVRKKYADEVCKKTSGVIIGRVEKGKGKVHLV
jgi:phosphoribosylaminoimidazole (AIR) synthetase